jgi:ribonucleoside-triphosphate reductase
MVPYVRKSFWKHFCDGLKYIDRSNEYISTRFGDDLSIDDYRYTKHNGKAYEYAMEMTERETMQAVEGMYHNLKIWAQ